MSEKSFRAAKNNAARTTRAMIIVDILYAHLSVRGFFAVRSYKHINQERKDENRANQPDYVHSARKEQPELIYDKGDSIREKALITDCEPRPFCAVHLALDCADSREAGRAEKVKDEEGVARKLRHTHKVENAEYADNLLLCDKTHNCSDCRGCLAEAERRENPADCVSDNAQNAVRKLKLRAEAKAAVGEISEYGACPDYNGRKQNNRTRLFDEAPAALPH